MKDSEIKDPFVVTRNDALISWIVKDQSRIAAARLALLNAPANPRPRRRSKSRSKCR